MKTIARRLVATLIAVLALSLTLVTPSSALGGGRVTHDSSSERSSLQVCLNWGNGYCKSGQSATLARGASSTRLTSDLDGFYIPSKCYGETWSYQSWNGKNGWVRAYASGWHKINDAQTVRLRVNC